jgi:hypothetical protein
MATMVLRTAAVSKLKVVFGTTLARTRRRTDWVRDEAEGRLAPHEPVIATAEEDVATAQAALVDAKAWVTAVEEVTYSELSLVATEVKHALGRQHSNATYNSLFGGGVGAFAKQGPARAAVLMGLVATKLRRISHPRLEETARIGWADRLDAARAPLAQAAGALEEAKVGHFHAQQVQSAVVRDAWAELPRLKRELKNGGMSEAEIANIIPPAPRAGAAVAVAADETGGGGTALIGAASEAPAALPAPTGPVTPTTG